MVRKILFKYIALKIIPALFSSVIFCLFLSELIGISFEQIRFIADNKISISTSAYIHVLVVPKFLLLTMPFALLMANIFTYSNLSRSSEIVALLSFGISINKILIPSFVLSILIASITFCFQDSLVTECNYKAANLLEKSINIDRNNITINDFVYNQFNSVQKEKEISLLLVAKEASNKIMKDLTLLHFNHGNLQKIIIAQFAYWKPIEKIWLLHKVNEETIDDAGHLITKEFETYILKTGDTLNQILTKTRNDNELNISDLIKRFKIFRETGHKKESRQIEQTIYDRFITMFSYVMFSLIGALIGINPKPKSIGNEFSLGLIIILVYYVLQFISSSLVGNETIPIWGTWAPILCESIFIFTRLTKLQ